MNNLPSNSIEKNYTLFKKKSTQLNFFLIDWDPGWPRNLTVHLTINAYDEPFLS